MQCSDGHRRRGAVPVLPQLALLGGRSKIAKRLKEKEFWI